MTVYTLFGQPASPATLTADALAYTMGVQFSVSQAGVTLTATWFFSASGAVDIPQNIGLYAVTGHTLVASQAASWSGAAGSGWIRAAWNTPPSLTSGTAYKAVVNQNNATNWYSTTANYWSSGPGSGGITSGPMTAPNNAGGDGGQDTFIQASNLNYPTGSFNSSNYWIDPEITAPSAAAGPTYVAFMSSS